MLSLLLVQYNTIQYNIPLLEAVRTQRRSLHDMQHYMYSAI